MQFHYKLSLYLTRIYFKYLLACNRNINNDDDKYDVGLRWIGSTLQYTICVTLSKKQSFARAFAIMEKIMLF